MPIIRFNDGTKVNLSGNPTDADILEIGRQLGVDKRLQSMGTQGDMSGAGDQSQTFAGNPSESPIQQPAPRDIPGLFGANVGNDSYLGTAAKTLGNMIPDAAQAAYGAIAAPIKGLAGIPQLFTGARDFMNETQGLSMKDRLGAVVGGLGEGTYNSFVPQGAKDLVNAGVNATGLNNVLPQGVSQTIAPKTTDEALQSAQEQFVAHPVQNILPFLMLGRAAAGKAGLGAEFDNAVSTLGKPVTKVTNAVADKGLDFLSFTSDTPRAAFDTMLNNRKSFVDALKSNPTQETVYNTGVGAVKAARNSMNAAWQSGIDAIANEYKGVRTGLPDNIEANYRKFADEYSFENVPQNVKSFSAVEGAKMLNDVNEVLGRLQEGTPDYAKLSILKNTLKNRIVDAFGGNQGSFSRLFSNYSTMSRIVEAADNLIKSREGAPKKITTAQADLQKVFDENKPAYLNAITSLERITGKPILEQVAALKLGRRMPELPKIDSIPSSAVALIKILASPIFTSPRMAAYITRSLKGINESPKSLPGMKGTMINTSNNLNNK